MYLGIDVGARWCHFVTLGNDERVHDAGYLASDHPERLHGLLSDVDVVAIDGPDAWADNLHAEDENVRPKFRRRCAEFALRRLGYAVSWATEDEQEASGWQRTSIRMYEAADDLLDARRVIEVYPHACFLHLAESTQLPRKSTPPGIRVRAELMVDYVPTLASERLHAWTPDFLDALVAAVTARDAARAPAATSVECESHPGRSRMHLPIGTGTPPRASELSSLR
jgi:predicted nuclease with RNAse H fold